MSKEIQQFREEMKKAFKIIEGKADRVVQNAFIDMFANMIQDTPVGDPASWKTPYFPRGYVPGTLKGNWETSIGSASSNYSEANQDASGQSTIASMKSVVKQWDSNKSLYFSNNTPYAEAIEFGYSKQAPQGMYRTNLIKFNGLISKYAKKEDR